MEEKETSKRGGRREGAGRKKTVGAVSTICIRIPEDVVAILDAQPSRSAFIIAAIRAYAAAQQR